MSTQPSTKIRLPAIDGQRHYYVVGKGNNSRLVLAALKQRPWLVPAAERRMARGHKLFVWEMYRNKKRFKRNVVCNHLEGNAALVTKKGLYHTMREYGVDIMPQTFHVADDQPGAYEAFVRAFRANDGRNLWILKPASFSNRGFGIRVSNSMDEIDSVLKSQARTDANCAGWIVQKYIEDPLLVFGRKFDIRVFVLVVTDRKANGVHGYVHTTANYVRTSSERYTLAASKLSNRFMHLTNDGVQKKSAKYGKFEQGNKLTMHEFLDHLVSRGKCAPDWLDAGLWPTIHRHVVHTILASQGKLNPHARRNSFELLGYDFMVDANLDVWLIEVNSNPCLDLCCRHLERELPLLIEDTLQVALDYVLPPPTATSSQRRVTALETMRLRRHGFKKLVSPPSTPPTTPETND